MCATEWALGVDGREGWRGQTSGKRNLEAQNSEFRGWSRHRDKPVWPRGLRAGNRSVRECAGE